MKKTFFALLALTLIPLLWTAQTATAGDKPFPKKVPVLNGTSPEGFAIGRGTTAYNGSPDGSIYKVDLRSGQGEVLVPVQDPYDCFLLGMRVDRRTNNLFVAGCYRGNAFIFDTDSGGVMMEYQLDSSGGSLINDLAITKDAVYFTDSFQAFFYRLPLSNNGEFPLDAGAATAIPLTGDFELGDLSECCAGNGIVATPNGKTLIIGHSNAAQLYRVDPATGHADAITVEPALSGFLDGIVMKGHMLYILTPGFSPGTDMIQVVELDKDMLKGKLMETITGPDLDGVASGAFHGNSLYVNNARYFLDFPPAADDEYWITKLKIRPLK